MFTGRRYDMTILVIRWFARLISVGFLGLFLLFLIGEGNIKEFWALNNKELLLIIFIPLILSFGVIISFTRELLGGILIITSVIGFNIVDVIASKAFSGEIEFAYLLIPGFLFITLSYLIRKRMMC